MGLCETKERKYNSILIPTFIKSIHSKDNLNNKIKKNDFFYFTELIIKYKFYNKLDKNNENSTRLITTQNDPNENNIFKVIKAIDKIQRTKFNNNTLNHPSLKSQSTIFKSQIDTKRSNSDVNFYDFKLNINGLFDKLNIFKHKKFQKILIKGPPNNLRWLLWICIARNKYLEVDSKFEINNSIIYNELLNLYLNKDLENEIKEDSKNILSNIKLIKNNNNWLISLIKLLKTSLLYDNGIIYRKEMINIIKNILIVSDCDEEESFLFFRYLFSSFYGLSIRDFFIEDNSKIDLFSFYIKELVKERLPNIYKIIKKLKIEIKDWIKLQLITLYENIFDFSITVRLWDCLIALGINFLFNFSISFFKSYEETILNFQKKEDFFELFNKKIKFKNDNKTSLYREKIIKESLKIHISKSTLKRLEEIYHLKRNIRTIKLRNSKTKLNENNNELNQISKIIKKQNIIFEELSKENSEINLSIPPIINLAQEIPKDLNIINELMMNENNDEKIENIENIEEQFDEIDFDETIPVNESYPNIN